MKKPIIGIILILLLAQGAQAFEKREIAEKELIGSEYGKLGEWFGFGEKTYKITYNDGSVIIQKRKGSFLGLASIYTLQHPQTIIIKAQYGAYTYKGRLISTYSITSKENGNGYTNTGNTQDANSQADIEKMAVDEAYRYMELREGDTLFINDDERGFVISDCCIDFGSTSASPTPTSSTPSSTSTPSPEGTIYTAIQGYKFMADGTEASIGIITVTGDGGFSKTYTNNPYSTGLINQGTYTVSSDIPKGYTVEYATSKSKLTTAEIYDDYVSGNSMTIDAQSGVANNVWFRYKPSATPSAGGGGKVYRGVDIRYEDGIYYVGDIPHDSIAEAKNTIDEMIAGKEQAKSPGFEAVFAIAGLVAVAYLVLRKKPQVR